MMTVDVAVIGGGLLGCFAARNLMRWKLSAALFEKAEDVCTGISRANSAIVYPGYDNVPGTKKAELTVSGNADFDALCRELDVPFRRCGSVMTAYDEKSLERLERKLRHGRENGVPGLRLLSGAQALSLEPMLAPGILGALYAPTTGTVNPWQLGIAAFEQAKNNGLHACLQTAVTGIERVRGGYLLRTNREDVFCGAVINCGGAQADLVEQLAFAPDVRLRLDSAQYLVFDKEAPKPSHIVFQQASACGKGITAVPCTEGNLLISGPRLALTTPFATTPEGLRELAHASKALLPALDLGRVIRSFGALRPNAFRETGESIHDFCITNPAPGFFSLIGVKTPGLTCADGLGRLLARRTAEFLSVGENPAFLASRKAIEKDDDSEVVCLCETVTRAQVLEAIRRGAVTVDGVKRRVGSGMGRCQGSRCALAIGKILEECGHAAR